jgi:DNA (cytosine-5)-methyltransferase 1
MNSKLPSGTIDCGHRNYFHYKENRIPTARESARIQSFPDNYFFTGNKTSQYTQIGNAVPVLLSSAIAVAIKEYLKEVE